MAFSIAEEQIYQRNRNIKVSDKQDYERTLMNETTKSHCIRINIVGHSLAGKTSLAKRLLEQEFQSTTIPTNSIDTHVYEVYATEEGGWKIFKEQHVYKECYSKTIAFSEQIDTSTIDEESRQEKQMEKPLLKRHVTDIENFRLKKQARIDREAVPTFINIWDFGGQAVFHATHQLFYSPDSIYLLVIDLSGSVEASLRNTEFHKDVQENLNLKTIEELCIYWINTIFAYTGTKTRKPPIFLVGTHKDQMNCPSDVDKNEQAKKMFARIKQHFKDFIEEQIQSQTFFIDNTVSSDDETESLKREILKYAKENIEVEREIPKKWIPLENSLREMKDRNYATFQEIREVNEQCMVPLDSDEELNDFLAYQHRQGTIVYFQNLKLSNHVVLNPQWLIDAFKSVITDKEFFKGTEDDRVMLFEDAKIRPKAFDDIWRKHNTFYKRKDILLEILKQFGVIARPKVEIGDNLVKDEDFYYVPSLLTKKCDCHIENILCSSPDKSIMKESIPLQFVIKTPVLPPSQYNSIVSAIITKWPILQYKGERQFFVDRCIVKLLDEKRRSINTSNIDTKPEINHYGSIKMPKIPGNVIEIKVYGIATYLTPEERSSAETSGSFVLSSRKCDQFRRFVEKALRDCLERFLVDSSEKYEVCMQELDVTTKKMCTVGIKNLMQHWFADSVESIEDKQWCKRITEKELSKVTNALGRNWEILCLSLGVQQTQMDRINESREPVAVRMFRALNEWRKQNEDKATWDTLKTELRRNPSVTYDLDVLKTIMEES